MKKVKMSDDIVNNVYTINDITQDDGILFDQVVVENFDYNMDGLFSNIDKWNEFTTYIEDNGIDKWFEENAKYYDLENYEKTNEYATYIIRFKNSINKALNVIGDTVYIEEVKKIKCKISYNTYNFNNQPDDIIKHYGSIKIYMNVLEIL